MTREEAISGYIVPCEDTISRQAVLNTIRDWWKTAMMADGEPTLCDSIRDLQPVTPQPKTGHCKDCKYFEYDSITKVNGVKLIFAHEICSKWGDGCKTKEDGYCFMFEPQESEG